MRKILLLLAVFTISLCLIPSIQAANKYEITWYSAFPSGTTIQAFQPLSTITPAIYGDYTDCNVSITAWGTLGTETNKELLMKYYNPLSTLVTSTTRGITGNITESSFGTSISTNQLANGAYESMANLTWAGNAGDGFITLENSFSCEAPTRYLTFKNYVSDDSNDTVQDSQSDRVNTYTMSCIGNPYPCWDNAVRALDSTSFQAGNITIPFKGNSSRTKKFNADNTDTQQHFFEFFVFNSSATGIVNMTVQKPLVWEMWAPGPAAKGHTIDPSFAAYVWKLDEPENNVTVCGTLGTTTFPCSVELPLDADTVYVIAWHYMATVAPTQTDIDHWIVTRWNVTIDTYIPDYDCGPWSDCISGSKWRTCVDTGPGNAADKVEFRACYTTPTENLTLGFDDGNMTNVWYCWQNWACGIQIGYKSVMYPNNWGVLNSVRNYTNFLGIAGNNASANIGDYVKVVQDSTAPDGDGRVLKMWYNPPKANMPQYGPGAEGDHDNVTCVNKSFGGLSIVYSDVNETLFIQKNVTFPSPYMSLFFNVKKCREPELQYPAPNWPILGQVCGPDTCYTSSGNCTEEPKGRFLVRLTNADTFKRVFQQVENVYETDTWEGREYQMDELDVNGNYTLYLFILPEDSHFDTDSYCLYFDDIKFNIRDETLVCESYCDDDIYGLLHRAILVDGACEFTEIQFDRSCIDPEIWPEIDEKQDFCDPGCADASYAYWDYNNITMEWFLIENSDFCIEWCADEDAKIEITEVLDAEGFSEMFAFFFSPLWISILIALGMGALVGAKTNQPTIGLMTITLLLLGFTVMGFFPIWLFIVVIVFAGFVMARGTMGSLTGGG